MSNINYKNISNNINSINSKIESCQNMNTCYIIFNKSEDYFTKKNTIYNKRYNKQDNKHKIYNISKKQQIIIKNKIMTVIT